MNFINSNSLFYKLRSQNKNIWNNYIYHEFIDKIFNEKLNLSSFHDFLIQDCLFLIELSKAYGFAIYKSTDLISISHFSNILNIILNRELKKSLDLLKKWNISQEEVLSKSKSDAIIEYTQYIMHHISIDNIIEFQVSLLPCIVGYYEIANRFRLTYPNKINMHLYGDWIKLYTSENAKQAVIDEITFIDYNLKKLDYRYNIENFHSIFYNAILLEMNFWEFIINK